MGKNTIIFILFFVNLQSLLLAQSPAQNHTKYWFYRYRLLSQFMQVGEQDCGKPSGFSIPAGEIHREADPINQTLGFGDATSYIGYYIGTLATEYKLFLDHQQWESADRTLQELYYAMRAFERLDRNAEVLMEPMKSSGAFPDCNTSRNGFFLRDDVEKISANENINSWFNQEFLKGKNPGEYSPLRTARGTTSDFSTSDHQFMSQDQAANIFMGMALVVKCVHGSWNGYNFKEEAKNHVRNIANHLAKAEWVTTYPHNKKPIPSYPYSAIPMSYGFAQAAGKIVNEEWARKKLVIGAFSQSPFENVASGLTYDYWNNLSYPAGIFPFSERYHERERHIVGVKFASNGYVNAIIGGLSSVGNSWRVGLIPKTVFNGKQDGIPYPCYLCKDMCFTCTLFGTICWNYSCGCGWHRCSIELPWLTVTCYEQNIDSYVMGLIGEEIGGFGYFTANAMDILNALGIDVKFCAPFKLPEVSYNITGKSLSKYGNMFEIPIFALMHRFLHNGKGDYDMDIDKIKSYINSAPCDGPHKNPYYDPNVNKDGMGDEGVAGWRQGCRWEKANDAFFYPKTGSASFNGLDYMMYYNLYRLVYGDDGARGYEDERYNKISGTYPRDASQRFWGSKEYRPAKENGFNTMTVTDMRVLAKSNNYTGDVEVQASGQIKIKSLKVEEGAHFKATVDPVFLCPSSQNALARMGGAELRESIDTTLRETDYIDKLKSAILQSPELKKWKYEYGNTSIQEYLSYSDKKAVQSIATVYPNPSSKFQPVFFNIVLYRPETAQIAVVNNLGVKKTILEAASYTIGKNTIQLPASMLEAGLNFIEFKGTNTKAIVKCIVQ